MGEKPPKEISLFVQLKLRRTVLLFFFSER
jgi:hypothetical protein